MTKHTPGPWEIGKLNSGPVAGSIPIHTEGYMETYRNGQLICSVYGTAAISEANARLIAAAPELLVACRRLLNVVSSKPITLEEQADIITVARVTIAKAEGKGVYNED